MSSTDEFGSPEDASDSDRRDADPYRAPEIPIEQSNEDDSNDSGAPIFRQELVLPAAIIWNIPPIVCIAWMMLGNPPEHFFERAMFAWAACIPVCALAAAFIPPIQRRLFRPGVSFRRTRNALVGIAVIWGIFLGIAATLVP